MSERPQPISPAGFADFLVQMAEDIRDGKVLAIGFDQQPLPGQVNLMSVRYVRLAAPATEGEKVMLVGTTDGDTVGVFTDEAAADAACTSERHFIADVPLNRALPSHAPLNERYPRQERAA